MSQILIQKENPVTIKNVAETRAIVYVNSGPPGPAGTTTHASLSTLQGGTVGEYYHLNADQYNVLSNGSGSHNTLSGLQGGTVGEYWHLTTTQYTDLTNTTEGRIIPSGSTAQRPSSTVSPVIRYNTDLGVFEGYNKNSDSWGSLGGVMDIDQDTYITVEESPDEDIIRFYTAGTQVASMGTLGIRLVPTLTTNDIYSNGNIYIESNKVLNLNPTGTGKLEYSASVSNLWGDGGIVLKTYNGAWQNSISIDANGDTNFLGIATFQSDVNVNGNLNVQGTVNSIGTENLEVADKFITINAGTATLTATAGIIVNRVDQSNETFVFDPTTNQWQFRDELGTIHLKYDLDTKSLSNINGIYFGDNDTGIYESSDDVLKLNFSGTPYWTLDANYISSGTSYGGALKRSPGTYAAPVLTFTSDADTGLWSDGSLLGIAVSSTTVSLMSSTYSYFVGNVGIGITTPSLSLHVSSTNNDHLRLEYDASNYSDIYVSNLGILKIDSTGTAGYVDIIQNHTSYGFLVHRDSAWGGFGLDASLHTRLSSHDSSHDIILYTNNFLDERLRMHAATDEVEASGTLSSQKYIGKDSSDVKQFEMVYEEVSETIQFNFL